jgi:hypothetical protein
MKELYKYEFSTGNCCLMIMWCCDNVCCVFFLYKIFVLFNFDDIVIGTIHPPHDRKQWLGITTYSVNRVLLLEDASTPICWSSSCLIAAAPPSTLSSESESPFSEEVTDTAVGGSVIADGTAALN